MFSLLLLIIIVFRPCWILYSISLMSWLNIHIFFSIIIESYFLPVWPSGLGFVKVTNLIFPQILFFFTQLSFKWIWVGEELRKIFMKLAPIVQLFYSYYMFIILTAHSHESYHVDFKGLWLPHEVRLRMNVYILCVSSYWNLFKLEKKNIWNVLRSYIYILS